MDGGRSATRRPGRSLWITSFVPLGLLTAASWVGTLSAPALAASHPLLLMGLSTRLPFLLVAAATVPAPAYFVVGLARMVAGDPCHYLLGRRGGDYVSRQAAPRWPLADRSLARVQEALRSHGWVVIALRPTGHVLFGAGAAGLRPRHVAVADVAGTVAYLGVVWVTAQAATHSLVEPGLALWIGLLLSVAVIGSAAAYRRLRAANRSPDLRQAAA
ncbi:MAG: hypothetical protein ACRD0N_02090 [Acidimicrobiales bacterium]